MKHPPQGMRTVVPALRALGTALGAGALLSACIVEQPMYRQPASPPAPAYSPPPAQNYDGGNYGYDEPEAEVEVQASEPPPPLPVYEQPPCPEEGFIWTPGYWAFAVGGYYWVPGTWVRPPTIGVLWTPGYWGFIGAVYTWHPGYWGPHVGFYGGVNYGFGYTGVGFVGGRWVGNNFAYNTAVVNVNTTVVHNTYVNNVVVNNVTINRVSYNGGPGGVAAAPSQQERIAAQERHIPPTGLQRQHFQEAVRNPDLAARVNGGRPAIAATPRPAAFTAPGVIGARGAPPLQNRPQSAPAGEQGRFNPALRENPMNEQNRATPPGGRPAPGAVPPAGPGVRQPGAYPPPGNAPRPPVYNQRPGPQEAQPGARPTPPPPGNAPRSPVYNQRPAPQEAQPGARPAPPPPQNRAPQPAQARPPKGEPPPQKEERRQER